MQKHLFGEKNSLFANNNNSNSILRLLPEIFREKKTYFARTTQFSLRSEFITIITVRTE